MYRIYKYETAVCSGFVNAQEIPKSGTAAPVCVYMCTASIKPECGEEHAFVVVICFLVRYPK